MKFLQENSKRRKSQIEDDLISLYVFGEEEQSLSAEAEQNNGVVNYSLVKRHHYKDIPLTRAKSFNRVGYIEVVPIASKWCMTF